MIPGEIRDNLSVRVGCGRLKPSASLMMFDSNAGQRIHSNPQGGMYVQIHGNGNMGQGFFAPNSWLDEYYKKNGILSGDETMEAPEEVQVLDDTPKGVQKEFLDYWDEEMEELYEAGLEE